MHFYNFDKPHVRTYSQGTQSQASLITSASLLIISEGLTAIYHLHLFSVLSRMAHSPGKGWWTSYECL